MKSIKDKIAGAKLPERVISLCLRGDLRAEWEQLAHRAAEAKMKGATSLEGDGTAELAAQLEALREQIAEESVELRMRALSKRRWDELLREHPARPGNDEDAKHNQNVNAFFRAAIRESVVDPVMDDEDVLALLGDENNDGRITDGQYQELTTAVHELNRASVSVPFSFAAWLKNNPSATA